MTHECFNSSHSDTGETSCRPRSSRDITFREHPAQAGIQALCKSTLMQEGYMRTAGSTCAAMLQIQKIAIAAAVVEKMALFRECKILHCLCTLPGPMQCLFLRSAEESQYLGQLQLQLYTCSAYSYVMPSDGTHPAYHKPACARGCHGPPSRQNWRCQKGTPRALRGRQGLLGCWAGRLGSWAAASTPPAPACCVASA